MVTDEITVNKVSPHVAAKAYQRIKPLMMVNGALHHMMPVHPSEVAFMLDPTPLNPAGNGLKLLKTITTFHTTSGLFKPSLDEVYAQIPGELLDQTVAFYLSGPAETPIFGEDYHSAHVELYGGELAPIELPTFTVEAPICTAWDRPDIDDIVLLEAKWVKDDTWAFTPTMRTRRYGDDNFILVKENPTNPDQPGLAAYLHKKKQFFYVKGAVINDKDDPISRDKICDRMAMYD